MQVVVLISAEITGVVYTPKQQTRSSDIQFTTVDITFTNHQLCDSGIHKQDSSVIGTMLMP